MLWVPGWLLATFTDSVALRLVGTALLFAGVAIFIHGLVRSEDA